MSRERLIRELIARFNAGDFRDLAPWLTGDVVFVVQEDTPNGGRYVGQDAYFSAQAEWFEAFGDFELELLSLRERGDTLIGEVRQRAAIGGSEMRVEQTFFYVLRFEGDQMAFQGIYPDRDRAEEEFAR